MSAVEVVDELAELESQLDTRNTLIEQLIEDADYAILTALSGDEGSFKIARKRLKALIEEYNTSTSSMDKGRGRNE